MNQINSSNHTAVNNKVISSNNSQLPNISYSNGTTISPNNILANGLSVCGSSFKQMNYVDYDDYKINISKMNESLFFLYYEILKERYGLETLNEKKQSFDDFIKYIIKYENAFGNDTNIITIKVDQHKLLTNTTIAEANSLEFNLANDNAEYFRYKKISHIFRDSYFIYYDFIDNGFFVIFTDENKFKSDLKRFYFEIGLNIYDEEQNK